MPFAKKLFQPAAANFGGSADLARDLLVLGAGPEAILKLKHVGRADIRQVLDHIGVETEPPRITPARGPPLWDCCDAQMGDGVEVDVDVDVDVEPD